jgi:hypothetical protein
MSSHADEYNSVDDEALVLYGRLLSMSDCFAYQLESAPDTGYLHYQGYLELRNKNRHTWIQNQLKLDDLHFEYLKMAKGTPRQVWAYATKLETRVEGPWTFGEPRDEEKANKSDLFVKAIKAGATDMELCDSFPGMMVRSNQSSQYIRKVFNIPTDEPERTTPLEVFIFYGEPGSGKTEFARSQAKAAGYKPYVLPIGKDFWITPAMCGKKYVIIEDFKSNIGLKDLLNLLDKYPIEVPMKGISRKESELVISNE